ncbi:MAG: pyridoxal-dependent decarboxylase [Planctomycetota bacterium]
MSTFDQDDLDAALRLVSEAIRSRAHKPLGLALRAKADAQAAVDSLLRFETPQRLQDLVRDAISALSRGAVQGGHPGHFGFFRGATGADVVVAEALVALFDPQLALRVEAPALCRLEAEALRQLATKLGFEGAASWATSGATESNRLAILAALAIKRPEFANLGLAGSRPLRVYASSDSHGSLEKAVVSLGLGRRGLCRVGLNQMRRLDVAALRQQLAHDREAGIEALAVVATFGTTAAGAIDDIPALAALAKEQGLFLHIDAAWGGLAAFSTMRAPLCAGFDQADSLAFDGHKGLGLPTGSGFFFARNRDWPTSAFDPAASTYMPQRSSLKVDFDDLDPYRRGPLWSRRLATLGLCFRLASWGWPALSTAIEGRFKLVEDLAERLTTANWKVTRFSDLPLLLFRKDGVDCEEYARRVRRRGRVWIAVINLESTSYLRVAITNLSSGESDLNALMKELDAVRLDLESA